MRFTVSIVIGLAMFIALLACGQVASIRNVSFWGQTNTPAAGGGGSAPVIVQVLKAISSGGPNPTVTFTNSPTAGNLLVMGVSQFGSSSGVGSNNISGLAGWTKLAITNFDANNYLTVFYNTNVPANITTVGYIAGANYSTITVAEISGCSIVSPFTGAEVGQNVTASTVNPVTPSVSNGSANSIFLAFIENSDTTDPTTYTINGTGSVGTWNLFNANCQSTNNPNNFISISFVNQPVTTAASRAHGWTTRSATASTIICVAH